MQRVPAISGTTNLIDILDRVLDKGLVIAGDIRVSLANVELLTIRIRLLICSVDKAEQIGMNWWKHDPNLTTPLPRLLQARRPRSSIPGRATLASPGTVAGRTARRSQSRKGKSKSKRK